MEIYHHDDLLTHLIYWEIQMYCEIVWFFKVNN